jgi:hypothetical protein
MIRALHLTDTPVLLLFLGSSPVNEVRMRDRLTSKEVELLAAAPLLRSCLISDDKRCSFVCVQRGFIQSLISLRRCRGPGAWMVERLLLPPGQEALCFDLLERLAFAGGKIKAERLFLRLDSSSPVVEMAKQAGFNHYLTEYLYCLEEGRQTELKESRLVLRPKSSADEHGLFRLYSAAAPHQVRCAEGMTLQEWSQSRDRDATRELVLEKGGDISAWLRIRLGRTAGRFEIVEELGAEELGELVNYSLAALRGRHPVYCLVAGFQEPLQRILGERGFYQAAAYSCLSKQLAVRVHEPQLVPLRA